MSNVARLFIAEKPSLARAIAGVLPEPRQQRDGHIVCGDGNVVAWCAGHILEQAPPDEYDPRFKTWSIDHLPIAPTDWKLVVKTPELLGTIERLLPRADRVVNAGDPDREGQLLVDEVLQFLGYRGVVDRVLISDLNPSAVRAAIGKIQPNANFRHLYESALARQRADWLYGMNMTRLYTLLGRRGGYDGVLSVGRVQTPLLGLIVRRDLEIEAFQPRPYFALVASVSSPVGPFTASWQPGESAEAFLDDGNRLISHDKAIEIQRATSGQPGVVEVCTRERKSEAPPLPYALADLQVDAARRLDMSAKEVLDVVQRLYETHRLVTYPRSDCAHLPEGHFEQARGVCDAIVRTLPELADAAAAADLRRRSRAWNDKKVGAHHAIIPTPGVRTGIQLETREGAIYDLIARRYIAQFYPPFEYDQTRLTITVVGERFAASGRQVHVQGWRTILGTSMPEEAAGREDAAAESRALPMLRDGETVTPTDVSIASKKTEPPKRFTHATLVQAMTGIARFVNDPRVRQILRETDGIGTPATQATIIEMLFQRNFIEQRKKQIVSTPTGRALIQTLPSVATTPDMTAVWESAMRRIGDGSMPLGDFLARVVAQLRELMARGKAAGPLKVPCAAPPQARRAPGFRKKGGGTARSPRPDRRCTKKEELNVD